MDLEKIFSRHARRASFVLPSKLLLEGVSGGSSVAHAAQLLPLVRPRGDVRRSFGHEEQDGKQIDIGLLPSLTFVRWFGASCPVEDVKRLQRVATHCLMHPHPPLAEVGRFCTCRCCQMLDEKLWRKSPPRLRSSHAPQKSTSGYARKA